MDTQTNVISAEGMLTAAKVIASVLKKAKEAVRFRLESAEQRLNDAKTELNISKGMLRAAKAVEAGAAATLAAATTKFAKATAAEATALSSGNPVLIAAATAEVAAAGKQLTKAKEEHKKAFEHRKRLEERVRLAEKCVEIAGANLKTLQTTLSALEKALSATGIKGIQRLKTAYEDVRKYNSQLQPFSSFGISSSLQPSSGGHMYAVQASEIGSITGTGSTERSNDASETDSENNETPSADSQDEESYYDDNGNLYRVGNDLLPNSTYTVNGYTYTTDDQSRIITASGTLRVKEREGRLRIQDSIEDIGKGDERSTDDRGHLIGDQFDGSNGLENMVPQDAKINEVMYRCFENQLAKLVKDGHIVTVLVEPQYTGNSHRPDGIWVTYTVDGGSEEVVFFPNN